MRKCAFAFIAFVVSACTSPDTARRTDDDDYDHNPAPSAEDGNCDLDLDGNVVAVACDSFIVSKEQTPDLGNSKQDLDWYGYGNGFDGEWQGEGMFSAVPYFDANNVFVGVGQTLPDDGLWRMACGVPGMDTLDNMSSADEKGWCRHYLGLDTEPEKKWFLTFEECGVQKVNLCIERIDGVSYPNKAECWSTYVPPDSCG